MTVTPGQGPGTHDPVPPPVAPPPLAPPPPPVPPPPVAPPPSVPVAPPPPPPPVPLAPPAPPAPPEALAPHASREHREGFDTLGIVLAILLAAVGLVGAVVAWRMMDEGSIASNATRSALTAARERSGAVLDAEGQTTRSFAAWIDYQLARERADELRKSGYPLDALEADSQAFSHWWFVSSQYITAGGTYNVDDQLAATLTERASGADLDPTVHLDDAAAAEDRQRELAIVAVVVAAALPLLTIGEVVKRRLPRVLATCAGAAVFAGGLALLIGAW